MSDKIKLANKIALNVIVLSIVLSLVTALLPTNLSKVVNHIILLIVCLKKANKGDVKIPFKKPRVNLLILSFFLTIAAFPIAALLNWLGTNLTNSQSFSLDISQPIWLAILITGILPAIAEEIIYRGVIQGLVMKESLLYSVLISSIFFAVTHISVPAMMYAFFFGCIFALVRIATDNLLYTIFMHALFNSINVCLAYISEIRIPVIAEGVILVLSGVALVVALCLLFSTNNISLQEPKKSVRDFISKEGYVVIAICLTLAVLMNWR